MAPPRWAALGAALLLLTACGGAPPIGGSRAAVTQWAGGQGFVAEAITADAFSLFTLQRGEGETLRIYIEGDGAAWPTPFHPPRDPTPRHALALTLAAHDPAPALAYLGRPCQYLPHPPENPQRQAPPCDQRYWTSGRFAPEVVAAMDAAVDHLKMRAHARRVYLIGYSGGGVIALLLAERRDDLAGLVTVAAPLDTAVWANRLGLTPLAESLDPGQVAAPVGWWKRAIHLAGDQDGMVSSEIGRGFVAAHGGRLEIIPDFGHDCCWARDWPGLLTRIHDLETVP